MGRIWSGDCFCPGGFIRTWLVGSPGPRTPGAGAQTQTLRPRSCFIKSISGARAGRGHARGWGHRGALGALRPPGPSGGFWPCWPREAALCCAHRGTGMGAREAQASEEQTRERRS